MNYRSVCQRTYRRVFRLLAGTTGMTLAVLEGCDDEVTTLIIGGFNELANTMIDAFFLTITPQESTPVTTVQAITEAITSMLC